MLSICVGFHQMLVFPGIFFMRELWNVRENMSNMLHNTLKGCGYKLFCKNSLLGVHTCQNEGCHQVSVGPVKTRA